MCEAKQILWTKKSRSSSLVLQLLRGAAYLGHEGESELFGLHQDKPARDSREVRTGECWAPLEASLHNYELGGLTRDR